MNILAKTTLIIATSIAMLGTAKAEPMQNAKEHVEKTIEILKERATNDKGGHKMAAIKHLNAAIAEINQGMAFDQANDSKGDAKGDNKKKRK
jgi:hypothetical protein